MSFLLWQSHGAARIATPRLVLRAAEVPPLLQAQQLCEQLAELHGAERQRIDAALHEAHERGHAQGLQQGRRAASDEAAAWLMALQQEAQCERERVRSEIATLALQVVRKMLGDFADDAVLAALAETAAREALPARQLVVVVHPDVCNAVRERLAARAAASTDDSSALRFEVRADAACARGTCRLETEHGSIDASLEEQLARLAQAWAAAGDGPHKARA